MEFNKKYFVKTAPLVLSIGIFMEEYLQDVVRLKPEAV